MLNRVALVGRLTRDPELRRTGNGTAVTSFTLAVDRNFSTRDGQEADFINCVVWRNLLKMLHSIAARVHLYQSMVVYRLVVTTTIRAREFM